MAMRALRLYKEGGESKCRDLLRKCSSWEVNAEDSIDKLLGVLAQIFHQSHEEVLVAELSVEPDVEWGRYHRHSRREFVQRQLRKWKSASLMRSLPSIHLDCFEHDGVDRKDLELGCLRRHWQEIYEETPMPVGAPLSKMLAFAPGVQWPSLTLSEDEVAECLSRLPDTGAGPNGLTYKMVKGQVPLLTPLIMQTFNGVAQGEGVSSEWRRCTAALIPKQAGHMVHADSFRILALLNIGPKL
eukprot:4400424-Amphidinium_carterae.1